MLRRTRVKICGLTSLADAQAAVDAGADAIGLVFYPPSPRAVTHDQALAIVAAIPPFVTITGLFVNAPREEVRALEPHLDLLQFHGDESAGDCDGYQRPVIKALRMKEDIDLPSAMAPYAGLRGILLDAYRPGVPGGTGERFDWQRIPEELRGKIILAGGLDPDNVGEAIRAIRPYAVDVSGGVELAPGRKSADRINAFMKGVRHADNPSN